MRTTGMKMKVYFLGKIDQVRVNGECNFEYPGQRWVPMLVYYNQNKSLNFDQANCK